MKKYFITIIFLTVMSCTQHKDRHRSSALPKTLEEAVDSSLRSDENVERDKYQHPLETLSFFGVTPTMTVIEISPGAGYYTEILAPYLATQGRYVMAVPRLPSRPSPVLIANEKKLQDILLRHKDTQARASLIPFEPLDKKNNIKKSYADLVVTFNSVHNWVATGSADGAFKFFYDVLKPRGILGVVEHRIAEGKKRVPKSGYMTEKEVIQLASKAGLKFIGKSEINANPKDTADYAEGVWVLPPTYRLGNKDKSKYEKIGESDKMTLKFIRP